MKLWFWWGELDLIWKVIFMMMYLIYSELYVQIVVFFVFVDDCGFLASLCICSMVSQSWWSAASDSILTDLQMDLQKIAR